MTKFCPEELDLAQLFKAYGLDWTPAVGHYVLDQSGLIGSESPFQDGVYFILDLKHFLRRSITIEAMKASLCWLPDWQDARAILDGLGVPPDVVAQRLQESQAILSGSERLELYRLIEDRLTGTC
ncbi:MAG: hypothetical protein R3C53_22330 [Pirellulaceae bacterium]